MPFHEFNSDVDTSYNQWFFTSPETPQTWSPDDRLQQHLDNTLDDTFNRQTTPVQNKGPMDQSSLQVLPEVISRQARMQALQKSGGNFDALTQNTLTTGAFAAANKRQAAWAPVQVAGMYSGSTSANDQMKQLEEQQRSQVMAPLPGVPPKPVVPSDDAAKARRNAATLQYNKRHPLAPLPLE